MAYMRHSSPADGGHAATIATVHAGSYIMHLFRPLFKPQAHAKTEAFGALATSEQRAKSRSPISWA
jgi:hypothetical protein